MVMKCQLSGLIVAIFPSSFSMKMGKKSFLGNVTDLLIATFNGRPLVMVSEIFGLV